MQNVYRRATRTGAAAMYALVVAATFTVPVHSASAASAKTTQARHIAAARAHAEVPTTVACTVAGCKPVPVSCHAAPQAGTEPGYSIIVCP